MYIGGDTSTYKVRHGSKYLREDADGTVHIYAHAGAAATVNVPKILTLVASASNPIVGVGYFATAPWATGMASATAIHAANAYVGVPKQNVASDTDGWFQIGGVCTGITPATPASISFDCCINSAIKWEGGSFECSYSGSGAIGYACDSMVNTFAISLSSVSQGTYDWYLLGKKICGIATA